MHPDLSPIAAHETVAAYRIDDGGLSVRSTVSIGDRARSGFLGHAGHTLGRDAVPPLLAGRDVQGRPRTGHHHPFYLPADADRDGRIDHLFVAFRTPPPDEVVDLLASFAWFRASDGRRIPLALLGLGSPADLSGVPLLGPATRFVSATPFVLPRHPKLRRGLPRLDDGGRWIDGPEAQLVDQLDTMGLPTPVRVHADLLGAGAGDHTIPWHRFDRRRGGRGRRGPEHGIGFRLVFDRPVRGPFALGHGAHFGLGQFHPLLHP